LFTSVGSLNAKPLEVAADAERSGVVLSLFDDHGKRRDGFLSAPTALDLPAELAVLSACQTALGREMRGGGIGGRPSGPGVCLQRRPSRFL
jgi:CHAT domain-containing protein